MSFILIFTCYVYALIFIHKSKCWMFPVCKFNVIKIKRWVLSGSPYFCLYIRIYFRPMKIFCSFSGVIISISPDSFVLFSGNDSSVNGSPGCVASWLCFNIFDNSFNKACLPVGFFSILLTISFWILSIRLTSNKGSFTFPSVCAFDNIFFFSEWSLFWSLKQIFF